MTTSPGSSPCPDRPMLRSMSQFVTLKRGQNVKCLPAAFTEHGAIMAATVLVKGDAFAYRSIIKS